MASRLILLALVLGLTAHSLVLLRYSLSGQREQLRALGFQRAQLGTLDFHFLIDRLEGRGETDEYTSTLAWVATRIPESAGVLILAGPRPDYAQYYRASYELVPRRIWLGGGVSSVPGPNWGVEVPTDPASWRATIARYQIDYLLLLGGVNPSDVRATGLDRMGSSEGFLAAYLVTLTPEKAG